MKVHLLLVVLLTVSCASNPENTIEPQDRNGTDIAFNGPTATSEERRLCETAGGTVKRAGKAQYEMCVVPYADGGKTCTSHSQCLGECVLEVQSGDFVEEGAAATGECSLNNDLFGCQTLVDNGVVEGRRCVD